MPVAFFAFAATITVLWGGVMIALLINFRRQRDDAGALAPTPQPSLQERAYFIA